MGWGKVPRHFTIELSDGTCSSVHVELPLSSQFSESYHSLFSQLPTIIFITLPQQIYRLEKLSGNQ
jgi:hypothetical protein